MFNLIRSNVVSNVLDQCPMEEIKPALFFIQTENALILYRSAFESNIKCILIVQQAWIRFCCHTDQIYVLICKGCTIMSKIGTGGCFSADFPFCFIRSVLVMQQPRLTRGPYKQQYVEKKSEYRFIYDSNFFLFKFLHIKVKQIQPLEYV